MKKTIRFIFLTLFIWIILSALSTVNASSATINASKTSVTVGDSVKVTVTVKAAAWNLQVSGSATDSIIGYNSDAENQTTTKTYSIDTSKAGKYTVKLSGDITDEAKDTADIINTSTTITVNAKKEETTMDKNTTTDKNTTMDKNTTTNKDASAADKGTSTTNKDTTTTEKPKEKSNNAYLKTLGVRIKDSLAQELEIKANKYDFSGFTKTKTSYNVTIPKNIDSLKVVATPADSNAKVKITGNSGFEVGTNNKITIKVTAEDGKTTQTYTIKVTKLAEEEEKPGNVIEEIEEIYLTSIELKGIELLPKFDKDTYSYTAKLDDADVTELKVNAKANIENANIDISGNTNLVDGENTINILVTLEDSEEQKIYQIVVTKEEKVVEAITDVENNNSNNSKTLTDLMGNLKKYIVIAVAVVLFMIIAIIILIILLRRENKKTNEDEEAEEKAEEYNVYKNDVNEFENKTAEAENFIESLYRQRNGKLYNEDELDENEKQTLEEINRETDKIFADKVEGQSVEYTCDEVQEERRPRRKSKGKHSK